MNSSKTASRKSTLGTDSTRLGEVWDRPEKGLLKRSPKSWEYLRQASSTATVGSSLRWSTARSRQSRHPPSKWLQRYEASLSDTKRASLNTRSSAFRVWPNDVTASRTTHWRSHKKTASTRSGQRRSRSAVRQASTSTPIPTTGGIPYSLRRHTMARAPKEESAPTSRSECQAEMSRSVSRVRCEAPLCQKSRSCSASIQQLPRRTTISRKSGFTSTFAPPTMAGTSPELTAGSGFSLIWTFWTTPPTFSASRSTTRDPRMNEQGTKQAQTRPFRANATPELGRPLPWGRYPPADSNSSAAYLSPGTGDCRRSAAFCRSACTDKERPDDRPPR